MKTKTQFRCPGSPDVRPILKHRNCIKTLFYTAICCLFSVSLTAQQKDSPDKKATILNSDPSISWASRYNNIGMVYARNRQFEEAYEAFMEYEKRFSDESMAYRNWAMYYALQNEKERAIMFLQRAIELGYNDVKWLKKDDSMDHLRGEFAFIEIVQKLEAEQYRPAQW